jgi:hypothetical protein
MTDLAPTALEAIDEKYPDAAENLSATRAAMGVRVVGPTAQHKLDEQRMQEAYRNAATVDSGSEPRIMMEAPDGSRIVMSEDGVADVDEMMRQQQPPVMPPEETGILEQIQNVTGAPAEFLGDVVQGGLVGIARGLGNIQDIIPIPTITTDDGTQLTSLQDLGQYFSGVLEAQTGVTAVVKEPEGIAPALASGVGQALPGIIPAVKAMKIAGMGPILAETLGGLIGDFVTSSKTEAEGLSQLIGMIPHEYAQGISTAIDEFIADPDGIGDEDLRGRLVATIPGFVLTPAIGGLIRLVSAAKKSGVAQEVWATMRQRWDENKSPVPIGMSIEEVRADARHGSEIVAERLKVLVPENQRVASGEKYRPGQPDGRPWSELSDDELAAPGPGFKGTDADIERLLREAIAESSAAGQQAASDVGMRVTLSALDWDKALRLPLRAQLWYEISGEAFTRRIPYLARNPDEFITFTDVVGVTSPREKPLGNLSRSLAILSQKISGVPIDVDLTNQTGVQQALARAGSGSSLASGNKTGNFSDTIAMTGGADVAAPIPVNDVWVGRIFDVTEEQLGQYQSLHEPMAIFWNKMRDLVNETAPGQFPHESWQLQARGWVSLRGAQSDYAEAMDTIVGQLRKAGIPGVTPEGVITEEALRHPDFVSALRPTVQAFRDAPKATIEFGTTQTKTGARAATLAETMRGRPDDEKAQKLYREYNQILTSAMYASGRGKVNMWDRAYNHVMGRPSGADVSRIRMGTQERPFDVAGSFEGVFSPNIRVPLREMTDQQVALFNAIVGKGLRQDAMAASRIKMLAPDAEPAAGTVRGQTVFIKSAGDLSGDEIEAFSRALPEGFDVSTERVANGYVIDINPRFGDDGPVGITDAELAPATDLLADRGLGFRTIYHQHSSVYNEASEYAGILAARKKELRDGAVNELVERVGLTRREARDYLAGRGADPSTKSKRQRAGRVRATFTGRLGDLDEAIAAARETSKGVETKFKDWISAADKHLAPPSPAGKPSTRKVKRPRRAKEAGDGG